MKSTGVVRRIDELGRIVIPKEIRKNMRIKSGDNLEVFLEGDDIVLRKYSPIENLSDVTYNYVESFNQVLKHNIIVTDRDKVVAISGNLKKKYMGKSIVSLLIGLLNEGIVLLKGKRRVLVLF